MYYVVSFKGLYSYLKNEIFKYFDRYVEDATIGAVEYNGNF